MAFDTPKTSRVADPKYSEEAKTQILANFDLEIESRLAKIRARLTEDLEDFHRRHAQLLHNIPRALRTVTVEDFAVKYDGSIARFMEEQTRARQAEGLKTDIDASARKRKQLGDTGLEETRKASKTARIAPSSPIKPSANDATPTARRIVSGSTARTPGGKYPSALSRARFASAAQPMAGPSRPRVPVSANTSRPGSPTKGIQRSSSFRLPSATEFNPSMPDKTPGYPLARQMRETDTVMLSANGSPIANPWIPPSFGTSGEQLINTAIPEGNEDTTSAMLNSPPQAPPEKSDKQRVIPGGFSFSVKTVTGSTVELDPDMSPSKNEDFAGLTDSAKKVVRDNVLKLAERYGALRLS